MKPIPQWDVHAFECEVAPHGLKATGHVTHVLREGWDPMTEQYQVEVDLGGRKFRFTIQRGDDDMVGTRWKTDVMSVSQDGTLLGLESFALSNNRIEFLFEEALIRLSVYKVTE